MKWYILRHAEKERGNFFNPSLRHQDEPISSRGLVESQRLWEYFSDKKINHIYISQYKRTGQTAEYVAKKLGIIPIVDDRLNEIDNGLIDGMPDEQIEQKFPDVWQGFLARDHDFYFPGGECGEDAHRRIESFMVEKKPHNEDLLIVCHEGLIRLWMCHILKLPVYQRWDLKVDFCGITEIEYNPEFDSWTVLRFNQLVSSSD
jgi:broad specificity phosphatase PhoE